MNSTNMIRLNVLTAAIALHGGMTLADSFLLEEIIVTAQKREQAVEDVSLSITAYTGETIRAMGVKDARDVAFLVTNVDIKGSGMADANPAITVRGIGMNNFNANNNPSVGIYSDEVFLSSPAMINLAMMDVGRIEVLKGPQGTLYGRNSTGGALNIHSAKPTQENDGFISATAGNYETTKLEGAYGGGLTSTLAGRVSFLYDRQGENHHEFFKNNAASGSKADFGESESTGLRVQLAGDEDKYNWTLAVSYLDQDIANSPFTFLSGFWEPGLAFVTPCASLGNPLCETSSAINGVAEDNDIYSHQFQQSRVDEMRIESDVYNVNFKLNYEFDAFTLTSITGWGQMDRDFGENIWSIPSGIESFAVTHEEEFEQFSEELRLSGNADAFNWMAGFFYSNDTFESDNISNTADILGALFGLNPVFWDNDQETDAFAAFVSVDWELSETVTLTTGVRYSNEETDFTGGTTALSFPPPGSSVPLTFIDDSIDEDNVSWRAALEYRPNEDFLYYATVSTGFKSGGFFGDFTFDSGELAPFDSETVTAYELGVKATVADSRVQINGAIFFYDYEDIQTFVPASFGFKLDNLKQADIFGAELEVLANPADGLDIRVGVGYLDTEVDSDIAVFDGNELPNSAELQASGTIRYEFGLNDTLNLALQLDAKYTDEAFRESSNDPGLETNSYTTVNARIALLSPDGTWEVAAWGKNINDKEYFQEKFASDIVGAYVGLAGAPATYGVTVNYNF